MPRFVASDCTANCRTEETAPPGSLLICGPELEELLLLEALETELLELDCSLREDVLLDDELLELALLKEDRLLLDEGDEELLLDWLLGELTDDVLLDDELDDELLELSSPSLSATAMAQASSDVCVHPAVTLAVPTIVYL